MRISIFEFGKLKQTKVYRKKTAVFIVIFFGLISFLPAQEMSILFNKTTFSLFNPSFSGVDGRMLSFNSRSQWAGVEGAPRINSLILHLPRKKNVNLGLAVQNDRVFIENRTFVSLDYNYRLQLNNDRFLYLGIKAGGNFNNIDVNDIDRIYTDYNPALSAVKNYFTPVLGVGFHYRAPNYFFGIGMPTLFQSERFDDTQDWKTSAVDYSYVHFTGGINLKVQENLSLNPVVVYRSLPNMPNHFVGTADFVYKDRFSIGGGFSNNDNAAVYFSIKTKGGFELGYGYEFTQGEISDVITNPTHEIMIKVPLGKKIQPEEETSNEEQNNEQ